MPVPIVVLIAVVFVGLVWWLRTRTMNFMTPTGATRPLPEFMTEPFEDPTDEGDLAGTVNPLPPPEPRVPDEPPPPPVEFGDLEAAPGLAEYSEHASKGAIYLIRLAGELESRGQFQRALLAWERVLDTCKPPTAERTQAENAIARIRPTLPRWNVDPEGEVELLLQLGTARGEEEVLEEAAQEVARTLRKDSDDTLRLTPRLTTSETRAEGGPSPIAIYFSGSGAAEENQSNLLSTNPPGNELEDLQRAMLATCYRLIRRSVAASGTLEPPAALDEEADPAEEFLRKITRLHWQRFAEALASPPAQAGDADGAR